MQRYHQAIRSVSLFFASLFALAAFGMFVPAHASTELVSNGNFELSSATGTPDGWIRGHWGTSTVSFSYPVTGKSGNGARVTITQRESGDAKWAFTPVPVTAGSRYVYSDSYEANVPSWITVEYVMSDGSFLYIDVAHPAAASSSFVDLPGVEFTVPSGAVRASVFHLINQAGSLTIDNVSFKASDAVDASDVSNLIANPSFEIPDTHGAPAGWQRGSFGTNTPSFIYPVPGKDSEKAAEVAISAYGSGDAKWYFVPRVAVDSDATYRVGDDYRSSASSTLVAEFEHADGSLSYLELGAFASTSDWAHASTTLTVPSSVTAVDVFHSLRSVGSLTVDNYFLLKVASSSTATSTSATSTTSSGVASGGSSSAGVGSGQPYTYGCTDPNAANFNGLANRDDGSCNGAASSSSSTGEVAGTSTVPTSATSTATTTTALAVICGEGFRYDPFRGCIASPGSPFDIVTALNETPLPQGTPKVPETGRPTGSGIAEIPTEHFTVPQSGYTPPPQADTSGFPWRRTIFVVIVLALIGAIGYEIVGLFRRQA